MEDLQLHLALSSTSATHSHNFNLGQNDEFSTKKKRKRSFHESFSDIDPTTNNKRTLPLLIWDDNRNRGVGCVDVEEDVAVGWPPVKSWMKKMAEQHRRESTAANYITVESSGGGGGGGGSHSSMYVKVEMEGIGIARKIDMSIHRSYQALTATLIAMFGKRRENVRMYKLAYQDKEGDWLLAGDVPWERFVGSVRRLKLLRKEW